MCLPVPYSRTKYTLYLVLNNKATGCRRLCLSDSSPDSSPSALSSSFLGDHQLGVDSGNVAVLVVKAAARKRSPRRHGPNRTVSTTKIAKPNEDDDE